MQTLITVISTLILVVIVGGGLVIWLWTKRETSVSESVEADGSPPPSLPEDGESSFDPPEPEPETDEGCPEALSGDIADHVVYLDPDGGSPEPAVFSDGPLRVPTCEELREMLARLRRAHEAARARAKVVDRYDDAIEVGERLAGGARDLDQQTLVARERMAEAYGRGFEPVASDEPVAPGATAESID